MLLICDKREERGVCRSRADGRTPGDLQLLSEVVAWSVAVRMLSLPETCSEPLRIEQGRTDVPQLDFSSDVPQLDDPPPGGDNPPRVLDARAP